MEHSLPTEPCRGPANIDEQIAALFATDKRAFYKSLLLEYLSRVVQSSEVMFMLLLFGIDCGGGFSGLLSC